MILLQAQKLGDTAFEQAAWQVLRANRALDPRICASLLWLAGMPPTEVQTNDVVELAKQGAELLQSLHGSALSRTGPEEAVSEFGPLGHGLQVGCDVALRMAATKGLRFREDALDRL